VQQKTRTARAKKVFIRVIVLELLFCLPIVLKGFQSEKKKK